jgi:hypothetical protein
LPGVEKMLLMLKLARGKNWDEDKRKTLYPILKNVENTTLNDIPFYVKQRK